MSIRPRSLTILCALCSLLVIGHGSARAQDARPQVVVLATGGTIASRAGSPTRVSGYSIGFTGEQLLEMIPGIEEVAEVRVEQFSNIPSGSMSVERWIAMSQRITELLEGSEACDGVVVTHGTDTLDETAFFLHLTVQSRKPVVCTGAMRPSSSVSADGPMNLFNSIRIAADQAAIGMGVMVMLNDEINSARDVYKGDTHRLHTFTSGALGLLGWVDSDGVVFYRRPTRRHTADSEFDLSGREDLPRVDVVSTYIGIDEHAVTGFIEAGCRGLVVEGVGAGGAPSSFSGAWRLLREAGVVIVRGSRTPEGRVTRGVDTLPAHKARILLMLALTVTDDQNEIARIFSEY